MRSKTEFRVVISAVIALAIGAAAFGVALAFVSPLRVWEAFLVNLLFWTGLAQGGIVVSAALYMSQARWGGAGLYRLAESGAGFLPIGFLLFWALYGGRYWIFPWITHPIPAKAAYLNVPFLFGRDGGLLALMWILSWFYVRASRRPEAVAWCDDYESVEDAPSCVAYFAPVVAVAFVVTYAILAIDLVMSLSPQWYSTMFPAYFAFGAFLSAFFGMGLLAAIGKRPLRMDITGERGGVLHDLGKLVFAGGCFWTYLVFSMYLVIWYGDIPKETFFAAARVNYAPWGAIGWSAFGLIWTLPFIVLLARPPKRSPLVLGSVCFASLVGMWMERYVLVAPSLSPRHIPFGWIEILITIGFLGLFVLATVRGMRRVPEASLQQARERAA
jgi:hypothetical protein